MPRRTSHKIVLEPSKDGGYCAYVPALLGCLCGDSRQEALNNPRGALRSWLSVSREFGDPIAVGDVQAEAPEAPLER
ncbi:MAG: type II toxin-antitoxin system HicB family antitoxin [Candidatus Bipolaricaulis sp.]|nr:type II toxin-antitoxin system HicB family antitoxin [Candidatus Bipolaricaulis sp.]